MSDDTFLNLYNRDFPEEVYATFYPVPQKIRTDLEARGFTLTRQERHLVQALRGTGHSEDLVYVYRDPMQTPGWFYVIALFGRPRPEQRYRYGEGFEDLSVELMKDLTDLGVLPDSAFS